VRIGFKMEEKKEDGFSKLFDKKGLEIQNGFSRDLNKLMQFPTEGIFSTVLAKSDEYNYTLMCLAAGTDIDEHTLQELTQIVKEFKSLFIAPE